MVWEVLLTILTTSLSVLAWPSFTLFCPLYASIRAMGSDSRSSNQRCLAFWVLFSLSKIVESELAVLFRWLPYWPQAKGMATIMLVFPHFGGASYIYKYLINRHCTRNICTSKWNIFSQRSKGFILDDHSKLVDVSDRTIIISEMQEKELAVYQERHDPGCDSTKSNYSRSAGEKEVQKEWSCALCQMSTTSENCFGVHLQGKKHKAKEKELREGPPVTKSTCPLSSTQKRTKGMILLENLNQIANFLSPISRSITWCSWIKPESGWTKLNTDGSIHREYASLGGLLRDYRGEPICAFVSKVPQADIFLVELWAVWRGLVLALELGIKVIWVESDSMSVVKTINKQRPFSPKADSCLKHIWKLLSKFKRYHVSHSWRETNRAADHLAKMVLRGNDVVLWPVDFPISLCNIVRDDAKGKKYPRW